MSDVNMNDRNLTVLTDSSGSRSPAIAVHSQQEKKQVNAVSSENSAVETSIIEDSQASRLRAEKGVDVATETFSVDRIRETVRELEEALPKAANNLRFHVDEVLKRPVITVVDKSSGEVIRTLPSDEVIRVMHNIDTMRSILFEQDA